MESKWTTVDELHVQFEALALVRAAIKVLAESEANKSRVAHEVSDRTFEMLDVLAGVHRNPDFEKVSLDMFNAIDQAPRPTEGVFGPVE